MNRYILFFSILIIAPTAQASTFLISDSNQFLIGKDGQVYQRQDSTTWQRLPAQLSGGGRAKALSMTKFLVSGKPDGSGRDAPRYDHLLSITGADGTIQTHALFSGEKRFKPSGAQLPEAQRTALVRAADFVPSMISHEEKGYMTDSLGTIWSRTRMRTWDRLGAQLPENVKANEIFIQDFFMPEKKGYTRELRIGSPRALYAIGSDGIFYEKSIDGGDFSKSRIQMPEGVRPLAAKGGQVSTMAHINSALYTLGEDGKIYLAYALVPGGFGALSEQLPAGIKAVSIQTKQLVDESSETPKYTNLVYVTGDDGKIYYSENDSPFQLSPNQLPNQVKAEAPQAVPPVSGANQTSAT